MKKLNFIIVSLGMFFISCQSEDTVNRKDIEELTPVAQVNNTGKELFEANCVSCHAIYKSSPGPTLKGLIARVPDKEWIYKFVHNSSKLIAEGDKYANELYEKWNKTPMTAFPTLTNAEIDSIMDYCGGYE